MRWSGIEEMNDEEGFVLVIGCGSLLRSDDAVGRLAAEAVERWEVPGVRVESVLELVPELAEEIARARRVVFVDARLRDGGGTAVRVERIGPERKAAVTGHGYGAESLLALAEGVFGRCAEAWMVTVAGSRFALGEGLSEEAKRGLEEALGIIGGIVRVGWIGVNG